MEQLGKKIKDHFAENIWSLIVSKLSFGTHKETYPLCLNVSIEKGTPNHPNFAYENAIAKNFNESWCMKI